MSYDPARLGAACDLCPLRDIRHGGPVPPEWPDRPKAILVGEAPGKTEVKRGAPFVGEAGIELEHALRAIGRSRHDVALTNAVLCRPPENKLDVVLHDVQKENKARQKAGKEPLPTPVACCRPRLLR